MSIHERVARLLAELPQTPQYPTQGQTLFIVVSDPSDLQTIDEVGVQLNMPVRVCVGTASAIQNILKKSESSQRVLEEATEGFQIQILRIDPLRCCRRHSLKLQSSFTRGIG